MLKPMVITATIARASDLRLVHRRAHERHYDRCRRERSMRFS